MEVVVYQQLELLTYYPVSLVCPCRSQRKQPVMQMDFLRKNSGLSNEQGEVEAERHEERSREMFKNRGVDRSVMWEQRCGGGMYNLLN